MTKQLRPMLAAPVGKDQLEELPFPISAQPKYDGIRCLCTIEGPRSRTLKPIPNRFIQQILTDPLLVGFDGELMVGTSDEFRKTTSGIMSQDGEPEFTYYIFDHYSHPTLPFSRRWGLLQSMYDILRDDLKEFVQLAPTFGVIGPKHLLDLHEAFLERGYEGTILRNMDGPYKMGRSTWKQKYLLKFKDYEVDPFPVVGVEQLEVNTNPQEKNALGYAERSSAQAGKVAVEQLGAIVCRLPNGKLFKVGTGFTEEQRIALWKDKPIGRTARIRYFPRGGYDLPRTPSFISWET
jgi:DNA ligase 1